MHTIRITTAQNIDIDYEVASAGDRILARLIDIAVFVGIALLAFAMGIMGAVKMASVELGVTILIIAVFLLFAFYDLLCEIFFNGQSLGKRAMKIRVISLDGGRPTIGQYLIRWLLRIVDFSMTGSLCALIAVLVTEKKQRVGDIAAGTGVVKTHPRTQVSHIAFVPPPEGYEPMFPQVAQLSDQDVVLIHEVILNYKKSGNVVLLYNMAAKVRELLSLGPQKVDDLTFLESIIRDYNYTTARAEQ